MLWEYLLCACNNASNFHPKSVSLVSGKLEELRAINTCGSAKQETFQVLQRNDAPNV